MSYSSLSLNKSYEGRDSAYGVSPATYSDASSRPVSSAALSILGRSTPVEFSSRPPIAAQPKQRTNSLVLLALRAKRGDRKAMNACKHALYTVGIKKRAFTHHIMLPGQLSAEEYALALFGREVLEANPEFLEAARFMLPEVAASFKIGSFALSEKHLAVFCAETKKITLFNKLSGALLDTFDFNHEVHQLHIHGDLFLIHYTDDNKERVTIYDLKLQSQVEWELQVRGPIHKVSLIHQAVVVQEKSHHIRVYTLNGDLLYSFKPRGSILHTQKVCGELILCSEERIEDDEETFQAAFHVNPDQKNNLYFYRLSSKEIKEKTLEGVSQQCRVLLHAHYFQAVIQDKKYEKLLILSLKEGEETPQNLALPVHGSSLYLVACADNHLVFEKKGQGNYCLYNRFEKSFYPLSKMEEIQEVLVAPSGSYLVFRTEERVLITNPQGGPISSFKVRPQTVSITDSSITFVGKQRAVTLNYERPPTKEWIKKHAEVRAHLFDRL